MCEDKITCSYCDCEMVECFTCSGNNIFLCKDHYYQLVNVFSRLYDIDPDIMYDEVICEGRPYKGITAEEWVSNLHLFVVYRVKDIFTEEYVKCPTCGNEVKKGSGKTSFDRHILTCICCKTSFSQDHITKGGR